MSCENVMDDTGDKQFVYRYKQLAFAAKLALHPDIFFILKKRKQNELVGINTQLKFSTGLANSNIFCFQTMRERRSWRSYTTTGSRESVQ